MTINDLTDWTEPLNDSKSLLEEFYVLLLLNISNPDDVIRYGLAIL